MKLTSTNQQFIKSWLPSAQIHARKLETQWSSGSLKPLSHTKQKMDNSASRLLRFSVFLSRAIIQSACI